MSAPPRKSAEELRQEAALAAAVAQARERRFEARQPYEAATKEHVLFVRHFQEHIHAIIGDKLETASTRVLMWVIRYAWGEYALFAIGVDGFPKHQVDCALELGLKKTTVSNAVAYLQRRGYLADHPKLLIPVIAPALTGPHQEDGTTQQWRSFCELWKVAHSTEFAELEVVEAVAKRIRKVRLAEYKKYQESEKKRRASLLETARHGPEESPTSPVLSPFQESLARGPKKGELPTPEAELHAKAHAVLFEEIQGLQRRHPNTRFAAIPIDLGNRDHQNLLGLIIEKLGSVEQDYIFGYLISINGQFKAMSTAKIRDIEGLGILVKWAENYAKICGNKPTGRAHRTE